MSSRVTKAVIGTRLPRVHVIIVTGMGCTRHLSFWRWCAIGIEPVPCVLNSTPLGSATPRLQGQCLRVLSLGPSGP
jgi:hypothetical protein